MVKTIQITCGIKLSKNFNTITSEEVLEFTQDEDQTAVQQAKEEAYNRCIKDCQAQFEKLI
jgi:hypothetical protein